MTRRVFVVFLPILLFVTFFLLAFREFRRGDKAEGVFSPKTSPAIYWTQKARDDDSFVAFDAERTLKTVDRLIDVFLEKTESRFDVSLRDRDFYREKLGEARRRFLERDSAFVYCERRLDDARSARESVEIFNDWNDDLKNDRSVASDSELDAATAFLSELSESPRETTAFVATSALKKSGDFRDFIFFFDAETLRPTAPTFAEVSRAAAVRTLRVESAICWASVLPGTLWGRFVRVDWARWFSFQGALRRRWNVESRSRISYLFFCVELFGATRSLDALASVRLLR